MLNKNYDREINKVHTYVHERLSRDNLRNLLNKAGMTESQSIPDDVIVKKEKLPPIESKLNPHLQKLNKKYYMFIDEKDNKFIKVW